MVEAGLQGLSSVETPDISFADGVIRTLDSSLVLPHNITLTAQLQGLSALLETMDDAGIVSTLESQADVTLFIPKNFALGKLQPLLRLLTLTQLAEIVKYHAVPRKVLYKSIMEHAGASVYTTLQGSSVNLMTDDDGAIMVNDARVVRQDLIMYGGVAHIIDEVLVPGAELMVHEEIVSAPREQDSWSQLVIQNRWRAS